MKKAWLGLGLILLAGLFSGCGMRNVEIAQPIQTPFVIEVTRLVTMVVVVTATPEPDMQISTPAPLTDFVESEAWVISSEALNHVGQDISVRVETAQCSYQPGVGGAPTFCNDLPYPNHNFTFLVWGEDWSYLDQECVVVTGLVEIYQGKPQIEVASLEQVSLCGDG